MTQELNKTTCFFANKILAYMHSLSTVPAQT